MLTVTVVLMFGNPLVWQHKPESCEIQAHKGDKIKVHYRVSCFVLCFNRDFSSSMLFMILVCSFSFYED